MININYCRNGTCPTEYTTKIENSTQIEYGNERSTTHSFIIGKSESIIAGSSASFLAMGVEFVGLVEGSIECGTEHSFAFTHEDGFVVSYSTSTANTAGVEDKITCDGNRYEKISTQTWLVTIVFSLTSESQTDIYTTVITLI